MRFRLADLPFAIKIALAPAIAIVMLAMLAGVSIYSQTRLGYELGQVSNIGMTRSIGIQKLSERITAAHGQLYLLLAHQAAKIDIADIDRENKQLTAELKAIRSALKQYQATAPDAQKPMFIKLDRQLDETSSAIDLVAGMMTADFQTAASFIAPFEKSYSQMVDTLNRLVQATQNNAYAQARLAEDDSQAAQLIILAAALLTLVVVVAIALWMTIKTRRDIATIAQATQTLAGGNNDIRLEALVRMDELGAVVSSLMTFRKNQLHLADMRAEQAHVVNTLADGLSQLADGNLAFRLEQNFKGEYLKLQHDFNEAIARLDETLNTILMATSNVRGGANEISKASDDLSMRTEQQAAALEQTTATLNEIATRVRTTAGGAAHAQEVVSTANNDAMRSGDTVRDAVSAMHEIEASAKQITDIIGVIDEIAFQTNLLALNAGVEAARAGDAGRGFAVVASEVRALAHRSSDAAKEIRKLIHASTDKVDQGVALVGEAGKALSRIVQQIAEINKVVGEIASSARDQSSALAQVTDAVDQMDGVTQRNAAMVEKATAASHALAKEAEELTHLVSSFTISGQDGSLNTQRRRLVEAFGNEEAA